MQLGGRSQLTESSQTLREARRAMPDLGGLIPILSLLHAKPSRFCLPLMPDLLRSSNESYGPEYTTPGKPCLWTAIF